MQKFTVKGCYLKIYFKSFADNFNLKRSWLELGMSTTPVSANQGKIHEYRFFRITL